MSFDLLAAVCALLATVALWRRRPALCIVAANQISALRALAHVEEYGQPSSQAFLPSAVFSLENLAIARLLFLLTTSLLALFVLLPARAKPAAAAPALPRVPRWIFWPIVAFLAALALSQKTILTHTYGDPDRVVYGFNLSGGNAFLASIFLYEMVRRATTGELSRLRAFGAVLLVFIATDYLKGSTGLAGGFMITAAFLILGPGRGGRRRVVAVLAVVVLASVLVRGLRNTYSTGGGDALGEFADAISLKERQTSRTAEGVELYSNGVQYAAHVLECISLYEGGVSREWRSVYLPVVYTFQPSFLAGPLGFKRSKEAAWELADYYIHGGGIFVVGETYWNGGYLCALIVLAGLFYYCWLCDTRAQSSFVWLLLACEFTPNLLQGFGYGLAQVSRGIFNGLLALGAYLVWTRVLRRGREAAPLPVRA